MLIAAGRGLHGGPVFSLIPESRAHSKSEVPNYGPFRRAVQSSSKKLTLISAVAPRGKRCESQQVGVKASGLKSRKNQDPPEFQQSQKVEILKKQQLVLSTRQGSSGC